MHIQELLPHPAPDIFRTFAVTLMAEATGYPNYPTEWGPEEVILVENEQRKIVAQTLKSTLSTHGIIHKVMFSEPRIHATRTIELSLDDIHNMRSVLQLADERKLIVTDKTHTYEAAANRYIFSLPQGKMTGPGESTVGIVSIRPNEPGTNRRIYQAIIEGNNGARTVEDYDSERYRESSTAIFPRMPNDLETVLYDLMINQRVMGPVDRTLDDLVLPYIPTR